MTLAAGFVDAIGYAQLGSLYLSFMSGNSTRMGFALAEAHRDEVVHIGCLLGLFVLGAALGTFIADRVNRNAMSCILAIETLLFGAAALGSWAGLGPSILMCLAIAMGMQNLLHRSVWSADVGKGFVTGALVNVGQCLARQSRPGMARAALVLVWSWLIFVAGVALGGWLLPQLGLKSALLIGLVFAAAMTLGSVAITRSQHLVQ